MYFQDESPEWYFQQGMLQRYQMKLNVEASENYETPSDTRTCHDLNVDHSFSPLVRRSFEREKILTKQPRGVSNSILKLLFNSVHELDNCSFSVY
jgi:hypothetical protein